jgi:hypothetical protein
MAEPVVVTPIMFLAEVVALDKLVLPVALLTPVLAEMVPLTRSLVRL